VPKEEIDGRRTGIYALELVCIWVYIMTNFVKVRGTYSMRAISVSNDIIPIAEFKTNISKWFKTLQTSRHPLIITQNSKPAGVLLSTADYDELVYRKSFLDSVERGIADAESGQTVTTDELRRSLRSRRSKAEQCR
jgi:antitoxin YefM